MITTRATAITDFKARSIYISLTFLVALVIGLPLGAGMVHAATFTVTNTNDSGAGSLRQAITDANSNANPSDQDTIAFNIPATDAGCNATTGVCTISPASVLPSITQSVNVNGYSQPRASPNTLATGNDAVLKIELNGAGAGAMMDGIRISGSNSVVRGLVINRWDGGGVEVFGTRARGNRIAGNFIGTDASGTLNLSNSLSGVRLIQSPDNVVGGTSAAARNVMSANRGSGVFVSGSGARGNRIEGNYIGTDASGTQALRNDSNGVTVDDAPDNVVGGALAGARNVISANGGSGVFVAGTDANGNRIAGNYIGTDASGQADLGNGFEAGVEIRFGSNNVVGGTSAAAGNTISNNDGNGVRVVEQSATGNSILRNSIFQNTAAGILLGDTGPTPNDPQDPDTGPNNLQNYPIITSAKTSATATTISATLNSNPNQSFTIQFFSNLPTENEGRTFIGQQSVSTNANGDASTTFSSTGRVPVGRTITATATRTSTGDTSEFSAARTVTDGTPPRVIRVVPAENATNRNPATNITAFFSEDMRPASINQNTFYLREAGETAKVSATLSYDVPTKRAILNPAAPLERGTTYVATVTSGARDLAGNQLDQDPGTPGNQSKIWRFTVRP